MEILPDPKREETLSKEEICELIGEVAQLDARLRSRLYGLASNCNISSVALEDPQMLTVEIVAKELVLTKPCVYEMIRRRELPCVRIRKKHIRVRRTDLDQFISSRLRNRLDNK